MKKIIAFVLLAVMLLGLVACGTVNKNDVAILWREKGIAEVPNSLINAMERGMYIEKIAYKHYGADNDSATQLRQAQEALEAGCAALMVELVTDADAQQIVDAAKAKNVPVVFFNSVVNDAVLASYDKCALVATDRGTVADTYAKMVLDTIVTENKPMFSDEVSYSLTEALDRNGDGKLTYAMLGDLNTIIGTINKALTEKGLAELVQVDFASVEQLAQTFTEDYAGAELIFTDNDTVAQQILNALQGKGYNADRLNTHCVPVFTQGNQVDYKAYVMDTMPTPPHSLNTEDKDEQKAMKNWWNSEEVEAWKRTTAYLCNMSTLDWADVNEYLYTTIDVIGSGRLAGTIIEDYDSISTTAAAVVRSLLEGKAATDGIDSEDAHLIKIPVTIYVA